MQQRTALARTLANDPKILLLDELFGAVDTQTRTLMQELLWVDVALPRPRHYTVKTTPEFSALTERLTDEIRAASIRTVEMEAR